MKLSLKRVVTLTLIRLAARYGDAFQKKKKKI